MIGEKELENLRSSVSSYMSEKRYRHTLGVEQAAIFLSELCLPTKSLEISAAALLHDITKKFTEEEHLELLSKNGFALSCYDKENPAVLHSYSAPYFVKEHFSAFATDEILSAIEKHTLGDEKMSVFDEIIFLADFIEGGREPESCKRVRNFVIDNMKCGEYSHNVQILHKASVMEIESTIDYLKSKGSKLHPKTLLAKKALESKK